MWVSVKAVTTLGVGDQLAVHDEVGHQLSKEVAMVVDRVLALLLHGQAPGRQFNNESILVELLVQTRLEFIEHSHGGANDLGGQFLVFH
jgi:hypothetical protein